MTHSARPSNASGCGDHHNNLAPKMAAGRAFGQSRSSRASSFAATAAPPEDRPTVGHGVSYLCARFRIWETQPVKEFLGNFNSVVTVHDRALPKCPNELSTFILVHFFVRERRQRLYLRRMAMNNCFQGWKPMKFPGRPRHHGNNETTESRPLTVVEFSKISVL